MWKRVLLVFGPIVAVILAVIIVGLASGGDEVEASEEAEGASIAFKSFNGHGHDAHEVCREGEPVTIDGHKNELHLKGKCGVVTINGHKNTLHAESVEKIVANGHKNELHITAIGGGVFNGNKNSLHYERSLGEGVPVLTRNGNENEVIHD